MEDVTPAPGSGTYTPSSPSKKMLGIQRKLSLKISANDDSRSLHSILDEMEDEAAAEESAASKDSDNEV